MGVVEPSEPYQRQWWKQPGTIPGGDRLENRARSLAPGDEFRRFGIHGKRLLMYHFLWRSVCVKTGVGYGIGVDVEEMVDMERRRDEENIEVMVLIKAL